MLIFKLVYVYECTECNTYFKLITYKHFTITIIVTKNKSHFFKCVYLQKRCLLFLNWIIKKKMNEEIILALV